MHTITFPNLQQQNRWTFVELGIAGPKGTDLITWDIYIVHLLQETARAVRQS